MNKLLSGGGSAAAIFLQITRHSPRIALDAAGEGGSGAVELKTLVAGVTKAVDSVREIAEKALAEAGKSAGVAAETKAKADELLTDMNTKSGELDARLKEVEQKAVRRPGEGRGDEPKTLGQAFVDNPEIKAMLEQKGGGNGQVRGNFRAQVETKTILSASGTWGATTSVGTSLVMPERLGMVALPMRQMTVRDLIPGGQTNSNNIEYPVQASFTNNAAVVAENTLKPTSDMTFNLKSAPVRTLAHLAKASRQILDDAPMLQSFIDAQMRYGLEFAEEAEILYGDGTGQHLNGIITQATAYSAPFAVTDGTVIDTLRLAMLQGALALLPPSGIVLHPTDWARIEVIKDGMGRYLVGDPQGTLQPRLWSLPVVSSLAITAGTFLTGAFRTAAQIFDRMAIEVLISTENNDDFEKNMITLRAEERLALAVYRPTAFITGALP